MECSDVGVPLGSGFVYSALVTHPEVLQLSAEPWLLLEGLCLISLKFALLSSVVYYRAGVWGRGGEGVEGLPTTNVKDF